MYEYPQGFWLWLVEKQALKTPPPDAAYDYSLEPADAQIEPVKLPVPVARVADIEEVFGKPVRRFAVASSAND